MPSMNRTEEDNIVNNMDEQNSRGQYRIEQEMKMQLIALMKRTVEDNLDDNIDEWNSRGKYRIKQQRTIQLITMTKRIYDN